MKKDFLASIVVFLVALPLCMGIAIASGVPVFYGILSGIIGGLIVGYFTGSPLQVSGPAAGLVIIVYQIVQDHGIIGLGMVTFIAGIIQIISAYFKAGPYFRAISPGVIKGMLSGIGVIIFASQFHVMLDDSPSPNPITNLFTIPMAFTKIFDTSLGIPHMEAGFIGVLTILSILSWDNFKDKYKLVVPGALIGVVFVSIVTFVSDLPINKVFVEANLETLKSTFIMTNLTEFRWEFLALAIPLALVATAETLLCTNAVEKLKPEVEVNYNKELRAQGIGNALCGLFGALPITGVIVRSSANVDAGGETKKSTIFHGLWLFLFVVFAVNILNLIPTAALAAILVITGFKLMNIGGLIKEYKNDKFEFAIWMTTILSIISLDLLKGIAIGFAFSILKLLLKIHQFDVENEKVDADKAVLYLSGKASFLSLPKIANAIDHTIKGCRAVEINTDKLLYTDVAFTDYLNGLQATLSKRGITVTIDSHQTELREVA